MELNPEHLRDLKVVVDRETMLQLLPKYAVVAELGVDEGDFSEEILRIARPRELHLIDPWDSSRYDDGKLKRVLERFRREIASGIVSIKRGTSVEELKKFPDGYFDWIYVDTTHTYETTVEELETGRKKVKAGGIIAGHDYTVGNINKQLRYGVIQAVHEFCNEHNWNLVYLTHESNRYLSYGLAETLPSLGPSQ